MTEMNDRDKRIRLIRDAEGQWQNTRYTKALEESTLFVARIEADYAGAGEVTETYTPEAQRFLEQLDDVGVAYDPVNQPQHYASRTPEPIDVIEAWDLGFHLGNAVKYIARAGYKTENPVQDLQKAIWYLQRHINHLEGLDD